MFFAVGNHSIDFSEHSLVVPALSIGNVGQLATDLLIANFNFKKVGYLESPYVLPIVGNDACSFKEEGNISINLEVFQHPSAKVTVVQQRAPIARKRAEDYAKQLVAWVKAAKFKELILLNSTDAVNRVDIQTTETQLRYWTSQPHNSPTANRLNSLGWHPLEPESFPFVFKRGSAVKKIEEECQSVKESPLPLIMFTVFCGEGNSAPESIPLADYANRYLQLQKEVEWRSPLSWSKIGSKTLDFHSYADLF